MPELRTRSAGAKVTDREYAEIEKLAQARGLTVGEWCREVILAAVTEAEAGTPTVETLLAEVMALRTIFLNLQFRQAQGPITEAEMRSLIERADRERFRRAAERVEEQAARKKPQPESASGDGKR